MTSTRRTRARKGEGERLHEEIVAAATELLVEKGSEEAVSVHAIADAVGVTPPSIYLHFVDKEALMLAVCESRFQALDDVSQKAAAGAVSPLDEVRRRGEAYVRFGIENPEQYRILFMLKQSRASAEQVKQWAALQHMVEAVERCIASGEIIAGEPLAITLGLWAMVHGLTSLLISMPEFPWPPMTELIDQVLDMSAFGLVPRTN